jgi:hypothetical protein
MSKPKIKINKNDIPAKKPTVDESLGKFIVSQMLENAKNKQETAAIKTKIDALGKGLTSLLLK